MSDEIFEGEWAPVTGADTGDTRENSPEDAGFTEADRVFRSHFQHVNRLADRSYEDVRPAYDFGRTAAQQQGASGRSFDQIETDLENGWLNVRVGGGDWGSVREFVRVGYDSALQGRVTDMPPAGTTPSHERAPFSDPVPDDLDPTSPASPENRH